MCMQCMASAMTAGAAVTGGRAWLATHTPSWMTPKRLKMATTGILVAGVLAAGSHMTPAPTPIAKAATPAHVTAQR